MRKTVKWAVVILAVALLGVGLVMLRTDKLPYSLRVITTGSMNNAGSLVVIHNRHYEVGQPVTFKANGEIVTHRLLSVDGYGLATTKGDANRSEDPWHVPTSNIIGGVVVTVPWLGAVIKSILYLPTLVGIMIMLIGRNWIVTSYEDDSSDDAPSDKRPTKPSPAT